MRLFSGLMDNWVPNVLDEEVGMEIHNITPEEAWERMEKGARYLDVRTEQEFAAGHPRGAVHVPVFVLGPDGYEPNVDFIEQVQAVLKTDEPLVVGCKSGGRSQTACALLLEAGYKVAVNVDGGFMGRYAPSGECVQPGWKEEGLPFDVSL